MTRITSDGSELAEDGERLHGVRARPGSLLALHLEVRREERSVLLVLVEVMRSEDSGNDRNIHIQLDPHQTIYDSFGYEFVAVYAPVHDQACCDHRRVPACQRQLLACKGSSKEPGTLK